MASSSNAGSIVDFNTAMEQFRLMFPDLSSKQVEIVLRQNDGDIESSINDLLKISNGDSESMPQQQVSYPAASCSTSSSPHSNNFNSYKRNSTDCQPNCENDEKIALMMQNREFLRYLQSDQHFMRELHSDSNDYYSPSRRHETVLSRCKRNTGGWTHQPPPLHSSSFDNEKIAIPDGPLVDPCSKPLSRLSQKIKSKLPSMESSSVSRPEDIYPHTVTVNYATDEPFTHRLKNMSRSSQAMFLNLAKKFNMSRKPSALMPTSYADQSSDFSYDIHRSSNSHNTSKFS